MIFYRLAFLIINVALINSIPIDLELDKNPMHGKQFSILWLFYSKNLYKRYLISKI